MKNIDLGLDYKTKRCRIKNGFRIETMYVYYIVMEIYVLVCTNIPSPFYFLCIISVPCHSPTMDFTHRFIHRWGNKKGKKNLRTF
jgi:hypothetical protein